MRMFINFDLDKRTHCDNCGVLGTLMHLVILRSEHSLNLCAECFDAMVVAFGRAARRLKIGRQFADADGEHESESA